MNSSNSSLSTGYSIPGGIVGKTTEFFSVIDQGKQFVKLFYGGQSYDFNSLPECREKILKNKFHSLDQEKREAYEDLSKQNNISPLEQMTMCLYGALNNEPDIDERERLSEPEYVPCNKRKDCKYQGVGCCCIMVGDVELSKAETAVFKLVQLQDREIADKLFLSEFTVQKHFKNIRLKTEFKDKLQMAVWAAKKGII